MPVPIAIGMPVTKYAPPLPRLPLPAPVTLHAPPAVALLNVEVAPVQSDPVATDVPVIADGDKFTVIA